MVSAVSVANKILMDMIFRSEMTIFNRNAGFMTCLIDPMVCQNFVRIVELSGRGEEGGRQRN